MEKPKKVWDLNRARELNAREPPAFLIRSGCARVLVSDLIDEVEAMRGALESIGKNTCEREPLAAAFARGVLEEIGYVR
jgi:hypothetical protein